MKITLAFLLGLVVRSLWGRLREEWMLLTGVMPQTHHNEPNAFDAED